MNIVSSKPTITRKELESVLDCLFNRELSTGNTVKRFESTVAGLTEFKYSLATNSITSSFHLALKSLDVGPGDEVIIPSYFDVAPISALNCTGAKAVLVDIGEGTLAPSLEQIKNRITSKTKAVIFGHMLGFPVTLSGLTDEKIPLIEDISHTIGIQYDNNYVANNIGTILVASFATSMLITTGNGGIALANNARIHSMMKNLRSNNDKEISYDCNMTDFQGAMGISQLTRIDLFIRRRREIAKRYHEALKLTPHKSPFHYSDSFTYQSFPVIFDAPAEKVEKYWKKNGIEIYKPISNPIHKYLDLKSLEYPNSTRMSKKLYSLPIYPTLTQREIDKISRLLAKFI